MPHIHIIVRLAGQQPTTGDDVDRLISAEVPADGEPETAELRQLVLRHMVHRKCCPGRCWDVVNREDRTAAGRRAAAAAAAAAGSGGGGGDSATTAGAGVAAQQRTAPRTVIAGRCKYGFPFALRDATSFEDSGRVIYRRRNVGTFRCRRQAPCTDMTRGVVIRNDGRVVVVGAMFSTAGPGDEYVVSYSPQLLLRYRTHINVDIATSAKLCRYLRKYLAKGPDTTSFTIHAEDRPSEYDTFEIARYLSVSEATWRVLDFTVNLCEPSVVAVPTHLPGQDIVCYWDDETPADAAAGTVSEQTRYLLRPTDAEFDGLTLTAFHARYRHTAARPARGVVYEDNLPGGPGGQRHFVVRRQCDVVCRLHPRRPGEGQRYYLRLALLHAVDGAGSQPRCYRDLATHGDVVHYLQGVDVNNPLYINATAAARSDGAAVFDPVRDVLDAGTHPPIYDWHAVCIARGLVDRGHELQAAMHDAVQRLLCTPAELRQLLVTLLLECGSGGVDTAVSLIDEFFGPLCEDYLHPPVHNVMPIAQADLRDQLLCDLSDILARCGRGGGDGAAVIGVPAPDPRYLQRLKDSGAVRRDPYAADIGTQDEYVEEFRMKLASMAEFPEQRAIVDVVAAALRARAAGDVSGTCVYIDAPAGCGKSHVLRCVAALARKDNLASVVIGSFTGACSTDFRAGRTLHSIFGLPLNVDGLDLESLASSLRYDSVEAQRLRDACVLIIDELPALHNAYLHIIDDVMKRVTGSTHPFGGRVVVAAGDGRQCSVVVKSGNRADSAAASVKASPLWPRFRVFSLTKTVRAAADPELSRFLDSVGNGTADHFCRATGLPYPRDEQAVRKRHGGPHLAGIPADLAARMHVFTDVDQARAWVHPPAELAEDAGMESYASKPASLILCPLNDTVDEHNDACLQLLGEPVTPLAPQLDRDPEAEVAVQSQAAASAQPVRQAGARGGERPVLRRRLWRLFGVERVVSHTEDECGGFDLASDEFLANASAPGVPPHELRLKVGATVYATRNLGALGIYNGTRMVVEAIARRVVKCRVLPSGGQASGGGSVGGSVGRSVAVPRIRFQFCPARQAITLTRQQFPLRVGLAATINRCQGKTIDGRVLLDLRHGTFMHGQAYVSFSRTRRAEQLGLLVNPRDVVEAAPPPDLDAEPRQDAGEAQSLRQAEHRRRTVVLFNNVVYPELLGAAPIRGTAMDDGVSNGLLPPQPPAPAPDEDAVAGGVLGAGGVAAAGVGVPAPPVYDWEWFDDDGDSLEEQHGGAQPVTRHTSDPDAFANDVINTQAGNDVDDEESVAADMAAAAAVTPPA